MPTMKPLARAGHVVNRHGSLSRTRRRFARGVEEREPTRREFPSCPARRKSRGASRRFVAGGLAVRLHGRRQQRGTGLSKGRAHDRIEVAEVGRTVASSWTRAAAGNRGGVPKRNAARGNPRGASARPSDGRRSGSSVLAAAVTGGRERVISAARSQTLLAIPQQGRGVSSRRRKPRAQAQCEQEDRRSAVTGASEDGNRSTSREENARLEKPESIASEVRGAS